MLRRTTTELTKSSKRAHHTRDQNEHHKSGSVSERLEGVTADEGRLRGGEWGPGRGDCRQWRGECRHSWRECLTRRLRGDTEGGNVDTDAEIVFPDGGIVDRDGGNVLIAKGYFPEYALPVSA